MPVACSRSVSAWAVQASRETSKSLMSSIDMSIAIVGGGLAGMTAADKLAQNGISVTVYDMGRSPGGRASTRRVDHDGVSFQFDHGCQFWKIRDPALQQHVVKWEQQGFLKPWTARLGTLDAASGTFTDRREAHAAAGGSNRGFCGIMAPGEVYVGAPGMSALCAALSQHTNIDGKWGTKVKRAVKQDSGLWEVTAEIGREKQLHTAQHRGLIIADQMNARSGEMLLVALEGSESPGYVDMQAHNSSSIMQQLCNMKGSPRFSLMLAVSGDAIKAPFDGASITNSSSIEWIARDTSKPGRERRDRVECWVAVTTEEYAKQLLTDLPLTMDGTYVPQTHDYLSDTAARIWTAVKGLLRPSQGVEPQPVYLHAQRWGSSFKADVLPDVCLSDPSQLLAACGDFCGESSSEGAIRSGLAAANAIMAWRQPAWSATARAAKCSNGCDAAKLTRVQQGGLQNDFI